MAKGPFKSMDEAIERFGGLDIGLRKFPMTDSSDASDWALCKNKGVREAWGREWQARRAEAQDRRPIEPRDFIAILAYETDGSKMDAKLGWPALGLWYESLHLGSMGKPMALGRQEIAQKVVNLIETGASVAAFQALYPDALSYMLSSFNANSDSPVWSIPHLLLRNGWDPDQWSPNVKPGEGCSSMQALIWSGENVGGEKGDKGEIATEWATLIGAAIRAGFDLESRSMSGWTALGGCLRTRGNYIKAGESDPRVSALLAAGADPTRVGAFWLSNFEADEVAFQAMLGRLEASQIGAQAAAGLDAPKKKASL